MSEKFPSHRIPFDLDKSIRAAISAQLTHVVTVDEFLRHWCEQVLLLLTTHYAISTDIKIPDLAKGLPRVAGRHRASLLRLGLELQGRAEPGTRRQVDRNL